MAMAYQEAQKHVKNLPSYVKVVELEKGNFKQSDFTINAHRSAFEDCDYDRDWESNVLDKKEMFGMKKLPNPISFDKSNYGKIVDFAKREHLTLEGAKREDEFRLSFFALRNGILNRLFKRKIKTVVAYLGRDHFLAADSILFQKLGTEIYGLKADQKSV